MTDFNLTARSPLCMMPTDNTDAGDCALSAIDTLGHIKALLHTLAQTAEGGNLLMIDVAHDAIIHALALLAVKST